MKYRAHRTPLKKQLKKIKQKKDSISDYWKVILILLAMGAIFIYGIRFWINSGDDYLLKNGAKVTGIISETGGNNVLVTFNYSARDYTVVAGQENYTLQNGERYNLLIDKNDPNDFLIDFSDPVFDRSMFTVVKVAALKKVFLTNKMEFEYVVRDESFTRRQGLPPNIDFNKFKARATLFVYKHDPRIAYVVFN